MYKRNIAKKILTALADTPVVLLNGARQTGKSTLAKTLITKNSAAIYHNLDDINTLASVQFDVTEFVARHTGLMIIDEVQKAPELFNAIKFVVDNNRLPGKFLLTGSANVFLLPKICESLAGRMEILPLWPLSQGEIVNICEDFIDKVFAAKMLIPHSPEPLERKQLFAKILNGGYPEVLTRKSKERQQDWFASYTSAILMRDIKEIANIEGVTVLPKLLRLLATRATSLLNITELSRSSAIAQSTLARYLSLLQATFLIHTLQPWRTNLGKRLIKTPKIFLNDTGLLSYLLGIDALRLDMDTNIIGMLLENFVVVELLKQLSWNKTRASIYHYRTQAGGKIDVILENTAGVIVGIEVKARTFVVEKDFATLRTLASDLGNKFLRGIVLYTGNKILSFGANFYALPINVLWQ
jgi:uncharacterized protein